MAKIILEGHNYFSCSIPKKDIYSLDNKDKYHCRILVDIKSEICCTQIQFVSYENKTDYWTNDKLLIAFNKAYEYIRLFIETNAPIKIFDENIFHLETKKIQKDEIKEDFQLEIPENNKIIKKISDDLLRIKEAHDNFEKCKEKLKKVSNWGSDLLNSYNINIVIDYLYNVANAGVVTDENNNNIFRIRTAFNELKRRKKSKTGYSVQGDIAALDFPKYFKTYLPPNDIIKVLDEIY